MVLLLVSCTKTPDYLGNISGGETTPGNTETTDPGKNLVIYEPEIKDDGNWHKFPVGYELIVIPVEIFYDIVMGDSEEFETYASGVMLDSTMISYYKITSSQVILVYTEQSVGTMHIQFSISANNFVWGLW